MKYILTLCCLALGVFAAVAADIPQVPRAQLQRYVWQQILHQDNIPPTLEEIQEIAKNHQGDIQSLAQKLIGKAPNYSIHSIWYKEGTFLLIQRVHDTGIDGDYFIAHFYQLSIADAAQGKIVYRPGKEVYREIPNEWRETEVLDSLLPDGMTWIADSLK